MAATAVAVNVWASVPSPLHHRRPVEMSKLTSAKAGGRFLPGTHGYSCSYRRAFDPNKAEGSTETASAPPDSSSVSEDDSTYLWKLAAGSVLGAGFIKYGSILLPGITSPNIAQALFMILAPMVVAVLLLLRESWKG